MKIIILSVMLLLGGCAIAKMNVAEDSYVACLTENNGANACEQQRIIYEVYKDRAKDGIAGLGSNQESPDRNSVPISNEAKTWMMNQDGRAYMCNNYGGSVNCN